MRPTRRDLVGGLAALSLQGQSGVTRYVRFQSGNKAVYGLQDGEIVRELSGGLFDPVKETGKKHKLSDVKLLYPCTPSKVLAVGLNYKSHIGQRTAPSQPEIFYKPITCLRDPGATIIIPKDAQNVHFEGELVVVVGKQLKDASREQAEAAIFGVTCGNDVSERDWQNGSNKDLQWWRAKGSDTFGPLGPAVVRGLDYRKSLLQTRVNGEVKQKQYISDLLFDCPTILSYISKYVTLVPGDIVYTGTPGATSKLKPGDVVEIDIEGIGVLRNPVA